MGNGSQSLGVNRPSVALTTQLHLTAKLKKSTVILSIAVCDSTGTLQNSFYISLVFMVYPLLKHKPKDGLRRAEIRTHAVNIAGLYTIKRNTYAVQQDKQSVLMSEFIHHVC